MAYIKGKITREIFSNVSNGYIVGLIRVGDSDIERLVNKTITFTGILPEVRYKTNYTMYGRLLFHNKYGEQFQVDNYEIEVPTDKDELIEFFSSSLFPIGEKTASRIVDKLGPDAINIIINNEDALDDIPRLSLKNREKIRDILCEYQNTSSIVIDLNKMGFSTKDSISIMKKYGNSTMDIVSNNIYTVLDIDNILFDNVDKIAINNGYELNDERRLLALTLHIFKVLSFDRGDTYLYIDELYDTITKKTDNLSLSVFNYILLKLDKLNKIKIVDNRYYLYELYESEVYISNRIYNMNLNTKKKIPQLDKLINQLEYVNNITYDDIQKDAIRKAINNNLTIITGGPGTGKTTIIKCIVRLLMDINKIDADNIALLSPTGRASRRLMEVTNIPAYTIHKYLKWDMDRNEFQVNEYSPNKEKYVIVDEASMIDSRLMMHLLKGINSHAKLILVGDYYQLPSVGEGQVLKDLIDCDCISVVRLNSIYRQTEDSFIVELAEEIKNKEINENFMSMYDDYKFIPTSNEHILGCIKDIVIKALEKGYSVNDIQVMAPIYKTDNGIDNLNIMLQEVMNPRDNSKNEIVYGNITYREGDKILQLVNDSDNSISNGDIGYITSITKAKDDKTIVVIDFFGNEVIYNLKDLKNITHGYAISVHKSQGGEYKMVIMPISNTFKRMLYNKLIYTAVTRSKEKLILVGNPEAFIYGIENDYVETRKTSLKEMIQKKYNY